MNIYVKQDKWKVFVGKKLCCYRNLKWHEWIDLRLIQLRDWFYLLGKEK